MDSFEARLNQILPKLTSPELLHNIGLGNEIGFYIFDYPPERELQLREFVAFICEQLQKNIPSSDSATSISLISSLPIFRNEISCRGCSRSTGTKGISQH